MRPKFYPHSRVRVAFPQRLKPQSCWGLCGSAEAEPFQNTPKTYSANLRDTTLEEILGSPVQPIRSEHPPDTLFDQILWSSGYLSQANPIVLLWKMLADER